MNRSEIQALRSSILRTMLSIRSVTRPLKPGPAGEAKDSETWEGNLYGRPAERLIIYLRSSGCAWAMDLSKPYRFRAGCLDCEHSVADTTYGNRISADLYLKQFLGKFEQHDLRRYPILCLYNAGSFFNEKELPVEGRRKILQRIAANGHVKRLVVE